MWKKRKSNFTFRKFSPSGSEKNEYLLINQDEAATARYWRSYAGRNSGSNICSSPMRIVRI